MNPVFIYTILSLCIIGAVSAVILYVVAQKFKVEEDPRIDAVEKMLPGANCGGCGYPGCRGLGDALVQQEDISNLYCPVSGEQTMKAIANYLGKTAPQKEPMVAVVRCAGSCDSRSKTTQYDGAVSCAIQANLYAGESDCAYGCLGNGDCVKACRFGALALNPESGLPVVDEALCTACGMCVEACPKKIIELRKKGVKNRRIYVACKNQDKANVARKACQNACIGCAKCVKTCSFDAISLHSHLAYIDPEKCRLCRKCVDVCSSGSIREVNFPPRKTAPAADQSITKPD